MSMFPEENKAKCNYIVQAIIFGTDETLLKIKLDNGFSFKKLSLIPSRDGLTRTYDVSAMQLRREYEEAIVDKDTLGVISAVKENTYTIPVATSGEQFDRMVQADLVSLDNQIRAIRLVKECSLRFEKISFQLKATECYMGDVSMSFNWNSIVPIGEALGAKTVSVFHCAEDNAVSINEQIANLSFPLSDSALNSCHKYYDLSYHTDFFISISLLMTALEILFLEKDARNKKEMLAKRCAVFLYDGDEQIKNTYSAVKELYKKRSEFVHEGIESAVTKEDIITLRAFVRDALLKALSRSENKSQRIVRVQQLVTQRQELFEE